MSEYLLTSKYVTLIDQTDEERFDEFVRTINCTINSVTKEKYGNEMFAYIIGVACNKVSDLFENVEDNINLDKVQLLDRDKAYALFADKVKYIFEKYNLNLIDGKTLYNEIKGSHVMLSEIVEPKGYSKTLKKNVKFS